MSTAVLCRKKMEQTAEKKYVFLICLGLALATIAVYLQVYNFEFINLDDFEYVTKNEHVTGGLTLKGIKWAFTTFHASNWHPLTWLSLMLDCQLSDANSQVCHITNVLFHIANTLLLFLVFKKMTGCLWRSAFVAGAFALHPLHVESVAWVSERKDVLSTFFWLLTMWAYVNYTKHKSPGKYALILLFFILGLMSKPMLVTLPFVLLLLDYWPLSRLKLEKLEDFRRQRIGLLIEKLPLFVLMAVSCVITVLAQKGTIASSTILSFKIRIGNAMVSYFNYIGQMFWPVQLTTSYPYQSVKITQLVQAVLCLIILSIVAIRLRKRFPYLLTGWLWYLGTMIPVIGLMQVGIQPMADRYTYVPLTGLFIIIAWAAFDYAKSRDCPKIVLSVLSIAVLSALALTTYRQVGYWQNSTKLFEHAINVNPDNYTAHHCLAKTLRKKGDIDEALYHFREAMNRVTICNTHPIYSEQGKNLITMLMEAGTARFDQGAYDKAIEHFREVISLRPDKMWGYAGLFAVCQARNKIDDIKIIDFVIKYCQKTLQINPNDAQIQQLLKQALEEKRKRNKQN